MDVRANLFGKGPRGNIPGRQTQGGGGGGGGGTPGYDRGGGGTPGYDRGGGGPGYDSPRNYGGNNGMPSPGMANQARSSGAGGYADAPPPPPARQQISSHPIQLRLAKVDDKTLQTIYIFGNICAVSDRDFPPGRDRNFSHHYIKISGKQLRGDYVVNARPTPGFPPGCISISDPQRAWMRITMTDEIVGELYDPLAESHPYLASMDIEVGFAQPNRTTDEPFDQDELEKLVIQTYKDQCLAAGQKFLMDWRSIYLSLTVKTVTLDNMAMTGTGDSQPTRTDPDARGVLTKQTQISFRKDAKSTIKIAGSTKRAAVNSIVSPDFKFEDMGIGGLEKEFSTIFRRAFASRIFPPGLIDKLGIMHVKGILLYGPPGTGKTLIARQIGKMLNAREPKVINGPEVLNKYVGQSEENIRKLFADAEKEYKEKGDESDLHIIIFDELDAVCKQRGSGAGGGTGVGDSVVNQLLSKLDGVDQLNNVLLIGMTNRKDMIDDALLRPGRLEVQIEISLPDEDGRLQILNIHTSKMLKTGVMDRNVDIAYLAKMTKNFSGAELSGLVKSATSFAFNRHIKVGGSGIENNASEMKVEQGDFELALKEVKPAFGVSDEEFASAIKRGIINYSPSILSIVNLGKTYANNVRQLEHLRHMSVLLHGPGGSGKTALATYIAMKSKFPFIKTITPKSLVGFNGENGKKDYVHKVFTDAYKSPLSCLIIDEVEDLVEWNPVGPRLSNLMVLTIRVLMRAEPPKGHRLLILATTSDRSALNQLGMLAAFDNQIAVPAVRDLGELKTALREQRALDDGDINEAVNMLKDWNNGDNVGVGIKTVLAKAESAQAEQNPATWYAEQMNEAISAAGSNF